MFNELFPNILDMADRFDYKTIENIANVTIQYKEIQHKKASESPEDKKKKEEEKEREIWDNALDNALAEYGFTDFIQTPITEEPT